MKKTTVGEKIWFAVTMAYGLLMAFGPDSDWFSFWGAMVVGVGWAFVGGQRIRSHQTAH